jgi:hypothetical protein
VVAAQGPAVRAREPHVTYEDHQSLPGKWASSCEILHAG